MEVGWLPVTARGPEAILNDPEAKLLLRHATESHRKKPPAQERSPGTQDVYCPSWPPWSSPYQGLRRPPPTPRATSGPGEHSPAMYRCLHSPHVQLVVPSFPPRGPRALLCPETPPAMEAREGHHMRRDGLGPKQGKGALGGHWCGAGREREKLEVTGKSNKHAQGGPGDRGTRAVW